MSWLAKQDIEGRRKRDRERALKHKNWLNKTMSKEKWDVRTNPKEHS